MINTPNHVHMLHTYRPHQQGIANSVLKIGKVKQPSRPTDVHRRHLGVKGLCYKLAWMSRQPFGSWLRPQARKLGVEQLEKPQ